MIGCPLYFAASGIFDERTFGGAPGPLSAEPIGVHFDRGNFPAEIVMLSGLFMVVRNEFVFPTDSDFLFSILTGSIYAIVDENSTRPIFFHTALVTGFVGS